MTTVTSLFAVLVLVQAEAVMGTCKPGWFPIDKKCVLINTDMCGEEGCNWQDAQDKCRGLGGHLVEFNTTNEFEQVKQLIQTIQWDKTSWWVGATDTEKEGLFKWAESGDILSRNSRMWGRDQPDNWNEGYGPGQDCAILYTSAPWQDTWQDQHKDTFMLDDANCNDKKWEAKGITHHPICQMTAENNDTIEPKWTRSCGENQDLLISQPWDERTWKEAAKFCQDNHGKLLTFSDLKDLNSLLKFANSASLSGNFWHSGNDLTWEGVYEDGDGREITWPVRWVPNQPDGGITENCLAVMLNSAPDSRYNGHWFDQYCNMKHRFICQKN